MGLVGCATALLLRKQDSPEATRRLPSLLLVIGATLLVGMLEPGIDNAAHIGGLTSGFVLGLVFTRISRFRESAVRAAALILVLASVGSVVWMLVERPRWEGAVETEYAGLLFDRPEGSVASEGEGVLDFEWRPLGTAEVRVVPAPADPQALALVEFARHPGLEQVPIRPDGEHAFIWVARALVTSAGSGSEEALELFVLQDVPGGPAAVFTFEYHPGDALLRNRLVGRTIGSARFR
jgi:hypothetical protein